MEDRRLFARIAAKFSLRFLDPDSGKEGIAETSDISANGLGLLAGEQLSTGTFLEVWLQIPDHRNPLYTQGEVVWCKGFGNNKEQRLGIHLSRLKLMELARALWLRNKI